jgi:putative ABC transport system permease protein
LSMAKAGLNRSNDTRSVSRKKAGVAGLFASFAAARLIATQLRGVAAGDPVSYLAVVVLVLVTALSACVLPAWRAARLQPWAILRRS